MPRKGYLANTRKEKMTIGGIGDFGADYKPIEVPTDVAHQYNTKEAKDEGWMVTWKEEAAPTPTPTPASVPTPATPVASPTVAPTPKPEVHK